MGVDQDADQLKALGYVSHFDRTMSKWENFSWASPTCRRWSACTRCSPPPSSPRPAHVVTYILVGVGQLMVSLVFGEIVSQFPISGGLYPWARRLVGKRWAWMAGWVYAGPVLHHGRGCDRRGAVSRAMFGVDSTPIATTMIALVLIVMTTMLNLSGTRLLARVAMFGFICELVGAIVVGVYLLLFARHQPLKALIDTTIVNANGNICLPSSPLRSPPCSATTASKPAATWPRRRRTRAA